ncbi:MAG TPA: serine hydrolase [Thermoanaerobaculia bacterium]|jgi:CubicO group peptidase (beta-lactamase class C family)|nr:serine hydrolase [Thermoanaerobaculia bacterium]
MSDRPSFRRVEKLLSDMVAEGVASAAVGLVSTADGVVWEGAVAAEVSTRFDYASLTKPFVASLALTLDARGALPLATRIGEVWPQAHPALAHRPLSDLLRHRSGLAAWTPLYHRCRSVGEAVELIVAGGETGELLGARAGTYSDLGYILWGQAAEIATGTPLAALLESQVLAPLGLVSVEPTLGDRPDIARSRMGTGQEVRLAAKQGFVVPDLGAPSVGTPQDGNGRFLVGLGAGGGVCGHAGLFGSTHDLWRLGLEWLAPGRLLKPEGVAAALAGSGPFALGWWRRTLRGSAGPALPSTAFGHTGFAGNSFWIDPEGRRIFVMLASRCDPAADMNHWRRRFNSAAARSISGQ